VDGTRLPLWSPDDGVTRVLVVTAHPDDVDFGAAGTVATFVGAGIDVAYCVATDGQAGGSDTSFPRDEMAALRRSEQRAAAAAVGVTDVTFLGYPDGRLEASIDLRRDVTRVIRRFRPERVVTQSPERQWDRIIASHPDHLALGEAAVCAVYPDSRNPFAHPELLADEGLEPHTVDELWLMIGQPASMAVDTTAHFDDKVRALRSHASQVGDGEWVDKQMRVWGEAVAEAAGLPPGSVAESFQTVATGGLRR